MWWYTAVINACASPLLEEEKEEAYHVARLAMDELCHNQRRYGFPNSLTYAAMLRVSETTLHQPERDEVVRSLFLKCCEAGQVGDVVVTKLKLAASEELYCELMIEPGAQEQHAGVYNLPRSWTRRVQGVQGRTARSGETKGARPERARINEVRDFEDQSGLTVRAK